MSSSSPSAPAPAASAASADVLAAALGLSPVLRERAAEIEKARRLPRDLAVAFSQAGFYRMLVPKTYGGLEVSPATAMETIEVLARADGGSAWCAFIGSTSGTVLASLAPAAARTIFSHPETRLGGVFAPRGRAEREGDSFRVNGEWQWGSGTENCDWVMGGCLVTENGEPVRTEKGGPVQRMMIAPASEIEFLDTWYVSGLSGSGSTDFAMRDVRVPAAHSVGLGIDRPLDRPLYRFPQFGLLAMGIAAVCLGLAKAAIDELIEIAGGKTPTGSSRPLAARANAQSDVSEAYAHWRSARAFYYETIEAAWASANREGRLSTELRRDIRLATTHATRSSARAVDLMYHLGGGTSVYRSSPLQRIFRDVHVATQHMMVAPPTLELTGRLLLGLEADTSGL